MSRWLHCILAVFFCALTLFCLSSLVEGPPAEAAEIEQQVLNTAFLPSADASPCEAAQQKQTGPRFTALCTRVSVPTVNMTADQNGSPVIALPYFRTVYQAFPPERTPG